MLPTVLGAYSVIGEREQGTLEPLLGTPVTTEEFMLGKALAMLVPAIVESYLIFGIIDALVWLLRPAAISEVALRPSILLGFHFVHVSAPLAVALGALLLVLDVAGWPLAARTFNRERLILGTR